MPILKSLLFLASLVLAQGLVEVDDVQLLVSTFYPPTRELRIAQEEKGLLCSACISFVNSLLHQLENGTSPEEVVNEVIGICKGLPASDIDDTVCEGIIPNYAVSLCFRNKVIILVIPDLDRAVLHGGARRADWCQVLWHCLWQRVRRLGTGERLEYYHP